MKCCVRGKGQPYAREKSPLPKRQYRQGQATLTPNQSFHDLLRSQNGATPQGGPGSSPYLGSTQHQSNVGQSYVALPLPVPGQSVTSAEESHQMSPVRTAIAL